MDASNTRIALIVEDELFIVLELEELARQHGFDDVAAFSAISSALEWLQSNRPHAAIIDYRLRDATCEALAARLIAEGIPTVIYSGNEYSPDIDDPALGKLEWVAKPAPSALLRAALDRALSSS